MQTRVQVTVFLPQFAALYVDSHPQKSPGVGLMELSKKQEAPFYPLHPKQKILEHTLVKLWVWTLIQLSSPLIYVKKD